MKDVRAACKVVIEPLAEEDGGGFLATVPEDGTIAGFDIDEASKLDLSSLAAIDVPLSAVKAA